MYSYLYRRAAIWLCVPFYAFWRHCTSDSNADNEIILSDQRGFRRGGERGPSSSLLTALHGAVRKIGGKERVRERVPTARSLHSTQGILSQSVYFLSAAWVFFLLLLVMACCVASPPCLAGHGYAAAVSSHRGRAAWAGGGFSTFGGQDHGAATADC